MNRFFGLLCTLIIISGCGSAIKRNFEPQQIMIQNGILSMSVDRTYYKEKYEMLRVWITLENLTNRSLEIGYHSFKAITYGISQPGSLLDRKSKTESFFILPPKATKKLNRAVEFLEIQPSKQIKFLLEGIQFQGENIGDISLSVSIPFKE